MLLQSSHDSKDVCIDSGIRHRHPCAKRKMPRLLLRHIHISTWCVVVVVTTLPRQWFTEGGVRGVQPPPPEISKISVESSIA